MSAKKGKGGIEVTSYSDWMSQLPSKLWTLPLFDLAIPGSTEALVLSILGIQTALTIATTQILPDHFSVRNLPKKNGSHDSVSYDLDISSAIIEPDRLRRFSRIYCIRSIVRTWGATQEDNITMQLEAGVRYFDLRIARKRNDPNPTRLYFYHGLYTCTDVETVLREIHAWAENHPREVIILAFSNFKGFEKNIAGQLHNHLISFIKTLFGSKLVHRSDTPMLKNCWEGGKNVIVSYDYPASHHPEIWNKITYYYANSMDRAQVKSKISEAVEKEKPFKRFFVCGLNLTLPEDAKILKYILRLCDSFTNVSHRSLPKLLKWLKQQSGVNIVASDVATRDNFVSTVVQLNLALVKA